MVELLPAGFLDLRAAAPYLAAAVALYVLVEQLSYLRKKGPLPGPSLVVPFLGSVAQMVRDPTAYWDVQAARARESGAGLAADFLIGRFTVFIRDSELSHRVFANDYTLFNVGLMALPVDLPGFAFRRARLAVARLVRTLGDCARQSKARMRAGGEPECLVDYWMQETLREVDEAAAAGLPPPAHTDDEELGGFLFDFLFAAQDASTSSLCWAVSALDAHPDVLARVRAEVADAWSPESGELMTAEKIQAMKYTQAVAREVVRYRPPATLVPHIAGEAFQLTETYTVPKGAIVFPSVYESSFQGFPEPDAFDPERFFSEARREDVAFKRNFLAFGAGAHQCLGQRYALNHLVLFLALFVSVADFRRDRTDGCDEPVYMPTIVPKDGCSVYLKQRCAKFPSF
uniref:Uncharacterized protein n=1 Tax=Avena sativa TaxID=4498 RepID=A0ACD5VYS5_AVESA